MRGWKWYYVLAFIIGGLTMIGAVYVLLRASGVFFGLTNNSKTDFIEYGE